MVFYSRRRVSRHFTSGGELAGILQLEENEQAFYIRRRVSRHFTAGGE